MSKFSSRKCDVTLIKMFQICLSDLFHLVKSYTFLLIHVTSHRNRHGLTQIIQKKITVHSAVVDCWHHIWSIDKFMFIFQTRADDRRSSINVLIPRAKIDRDRVPCVNKHQWILPTSFLKFGFELTHATAFFTNSLKINMFHLKFFFLRN